MHTVSHPSKRALIDRGFAFMEALSAGDRLLLCGALVVCGASLAWLLISVNAALLVGIPGRGGVLREGIVGTPRFINPVLAVTTADQDLAALIYAGLMTLGPDGTLVPDIARSVTVSEDGRTYDVVLKEGVTFHDGTPFSADDVLFTISRVQDPAVKSPLRASWEGVAASRVSDTALQFVLSEPYAPFIENLTLGILPKHIWERTAAEELPFNAYNTEPVGAGPYAVSEIVRNDSGIPESYELEANDEYFKPAPKIETLIVRFYRTEAALVDALAGGAVDSAGGLSRESIEILRATDTPFALLTAPLPRTFTLFFNQNQLSLFRDPAVRRALEKAVDRTAIVAEALGGYGSPVTSPIPPGFGIDTPLAAAQGNDERLDEARALLYDGGWRVHKETGLWEKNDGKETLSLSFDISTADTPVFEQTATLLATQWEKLGVPVTIKRFKQSDLIQTVIRPRQYDALLFGTVVGRELDFYSFWHSSQRNDPGLNVALYANITTDVLLSSARAGVQGEERNTLYQKFSGVLKDEVPAIFLYAPAYIYVTSPKVHNVSLTGVARGSERFSAVSNWFMETDSVWPFFADDHE